MFTVVSGDPDRTAALHAVNSVLWSNPLALIDGVKNADLVIVGGGGLFHDYSGFIPGALLTHGNWGLGFHVTPALLAALFHKPLMLYAVGVGPLFSEHGKKFTRAACEAASLITVRDPESMDLLASIGVDPQRVLVTADPAFALELATRAAVDELLKAGQLASVARPLVGVALRHWAFGVHPEFWEREVAAGLDAFLERREGTVLFVPFQQIEGEQENDLAVARRVHSHMRHSARARILTGRHSPAAIAGILGACDAVVGMRLHALIFSLLGGVPLVGLQYDPKVVQMVERVNLGSSLLDIGGVDADTLAERIQQALAGPPLREIPEFEGQMSALAALARKNAELAAGLLKTPPAQRAPSPLVLELLGVAVTAQAAATDSLRNQLRVAVERLSVLESSDRSYRDRIALLEEESRRQDVLIRGLLSDVACRETQIHALAGQFAFLTARMTAKERQVLELNGLLGVKERHLEELQSLVSEAERQAQAERTAAASALASHEKELASVHRELADARAGAQDLDRQWIQFRQRYRSALDSYRSQRAWRMMLVFRKGYSMLLRQGWGGRIRFLPWAIGLLMGRTGSLVEEELIFPSPPT